MKYLVRFKGGALVVSAPDPDTAICLAHGTRKDAHARTDGHGAIRRSDYSVYRATKDDERQVKMGRPLVRRKRVKLELDYESMLFDSETYFRGARQQSRKTK